VLGIAVKKALLLDGSTSRQTPTLATAREALPSLLTIFWEIELSPKVKHYNYIYKNSVRKTHLKTRYNLQNATFAL
jgi:hypothetical protein